MKTLTVLAIVATLATPAMAQPVRFLAACSKDGGKHIQMVHVSYDADAETMGINGGNDPATFTDNTVILNGYDKERNHIKMILYRNSNVMNGTEIKPNGEMTAHSVCHRIEAPQGF